MSGFSAGGHFAHKMQIVHSETVKGAGIMNGYPYIEYEDGYWELTDESTEDIADTIAATII
jgi:hypothetical protein